MILKFNIKMYIFGCDASLKKIRCLQMIECFMTSFKLLGFGSIKIDKSNKDRELNLLKRIGTTNT